MVQKMIKRKQHICTARTMAVQPHGLHPPALSKVLMSNPPLPTEGRGLVWKVPFHSTG